MGAWGPGLYQSDAALELKAQLKDWVRLPLDGSELLALAKDYFPASDDPLSPDHTAIWIALADQFHTYGIRCPAVFERATSLIDSGADDAAMRTLDLSAPDCDRRIKALATLSREWRTPNSQPAARRIVQTPEPHCVAEGDVYAYPTQMGNPPNTQFPAKEIDKIFAPDGWNAFVIAKNAHQRGVFAMSYVIRLHIDSPTKPTLEICKSAPVSAVNYDFMAEGQPPAHAAAWTIVGQPILKKMRVEKLGMIALSWDKVATLLNGAGTLDDASRGRVSGVLAVYHRAPDSNAVISSAVPLDITLAQLTAG